MSALAATRQALVTREVCPPVRILSALTTPTERERRPHGSHSGIWRRADGVG